MTPQLNVIEIVAEDIGRSLAFYRLLGIDVPSGSDDEPHVEATLPGGLKIAWDSVAMTQEIDAGWRPPTGGHRMALAFRCEDPADVDASYGRLVEAGAHGEKEPWDAFWGMRYAVLLDPDGNPIDLFADLPS